jgi:hypothetical protein
MIMTLEEFKSKRNKSKNHKYGAVRCESNGIKFPSKLEMHCHQTLSSLKNSGKILFFLRQIPFDLPGGYIHRVDFCVFTTKKVLFIESKGRDMPLGKLKRQQVEELFNVEIFVVKSSEQIHEIIVSLK